MKTFCTALSLVASFAIYIYLTMYVEWPKRNISYHDVDTLMYNQFAFPELLENEDIKIIEKYNYLDYFIAVDEEKKRLKLNPTIRKKTERFNFLEDVYHHKEGDAKWENQMILDSIEHIDNYTTESYLDIYRKRRQYKTHEKKIFNVNSLVE